ASSTNVVALTSYQALSTTATLNNATDNVLVTGNASIAVSQSVNAVLIVGDGVTVGGAAGTTLTVARGVASTGGTGTGDTVSVPTLAFGTNEGLALTSSGTTTLSSAITGTAG